MPYAEIQLGAGPCDESVAQVGSEDYTERSKRECNVYKRMLLRLHPAPDGADATLKVACYRHDYGTYREVVASFETGDEAAVDYAYGLESMGPAEWDNIARYELWWYEQRDRLMAEAARGEREGDQMPEAIRLGRLPVLDPTMNLQQMFAANPI